MEPSSNSLLLYGRATIRNSSNSLWLSSSSWLDIIKALLLCFHPHSCTQAGIEDRICPVDEYILTEIEESYCVVPAMVGPEFGAIAESIMQEYSLTEPNQFEEGLELYHTIVSVLDQMLIDFWQHSSYTDGLLCCIIMQSHIYCDEIYSVLKEQCHWIEELLLQWCCY